MNEPGSPDDGACRRARHRLLDAELSTLRGEDGTPLAAHLRACPRCRAAAEAILVAEERLARALDAVRPSIEPAEAVSLAEGARRSAGGEAAGGARDRRRRLWPLVPLAVAAAAALLVLGPPNGGEPVDSGRAPTPPMADGPLAGEAVRDRVPGEATRFALDVPERTRTVVFATRDPGITVVWFYRP